MAQQEVVNKAIPGMKVARVFPAAIFENGEWKEAASTLGHRADGTPWEGVERNTSFPQPAEGLPEHHTPTKPKTPGVR